MLRDVLETLSQIYPDSESQEDVSIYMKGNVEADIAPGGRG